MAVESPEYGKSPHKNRMVICCKVFVIKESEGIGHDVFRDDIAGKASKSIFEVNYPFPATVLLKPSTQCADGLCYHWIQSDDAGWREMLAHSAPAETVIFCLYRAERRIGGIRRSVEPLIFVKLGCHIVDFVEELGILDMDLVRADTDDRAYRSDVELFSIRWLKCVSLAAGGWHLHTILFM